MSNATSAEIAKARRSWKDDHLGMYLDSEGAEGHIVDVSDIGGHKFTTTLLLAPVPLVTLPFAGALPKKSLPEVPFGLPPSTRPPPPAMLCARMP